MGVHTNSIINLFNAIQPYCKAIYLGGSFTQKYLKNPHDIDFICFADNEYDRIRMKGKLAIYLYQHKDEFPDNIDFIQTRITTKEEHSYGSYINRDMQLICGEPVSLVFDPANKDRLEYIQILKSKINKVKNPKRYYQFYRGYLIISKHSYNLTEDEIENLNILHDQNENDKEKIEYLINKLIQNINSLKEE